MSKFNLDAVVETVQKSMKRDDRRAKQFGTGDKLSKVSRDPGDYVVMPDWFEESYGVLGLQFGRICQWAGRSDSGKTSIAIVAMKAAQEQGYGIIYVETEGKTTTADLEAWGVDPSGVMLVRTAITEEAFDGAFKLWDGFFKKYPNDKLLFIYDSYGNTVSQGDSEIDMTKKVGRVGGAAKTNRLGVNTMIAKMQEDPVAVLFINYTYANMGAPGRVNAGGEALGFFSTIIVQSSRKGWIEATKQGEKVRKGAKVKWSTYKNHYAKNLVDDDGNQILLPKAIELDITSEGIKLAGAKSNDDEE